jgi:3-phenylpropionate/trans-cinnamate dioxygenase ferredoxin reductase subunit
MIAIVGTGAAGVCAAVALRELGVEEEVCLFGSESVVPYERPVLSKASLTDPVDREPPPLEPGGLAERDIRLELDSEVISIDAAARTLTLARGESVGYDRLLLATGAAPRRLAIPGSQLRGIFYFREFVDAQRLRPALRPGRRIVIVGGGVIGLEVAASARQLGCEVTVIEVAQQLMGRIVPSALADAIADLHRARGVIVRTSTRAVAFEGGGDRVRGVVLQGGEVVAADAVVVGIGVVPRTELAGGAGLAVDDGVVVDEYFRSSDERIFAAGDVARVFHAGEQHHVRVEQWQPAQKQGRHAAMSMVGAAGPYRDVPWMWSDQHDAHIQMAGFDFAHADEVVRRGDLDDREGMSFLALRDGRLIAACGVSVGTGIARTVRAAQLLIEREAPVDSKQLGDPGLDLRRLVRQLARRS